MKSNLLIFGRYLKNLLESMGHKIDDVGCMN
jgi:hypothetical protein